jgi:hypothetical protein
VLCPRAAQANNDFGRYGYEGGPAGDGGPPVHGAGGGSWGKRKGGKGGTSPQGGSEPGYGGSGGGGEARDPRQHNAVWKNAWAKEAIGTEFVGGLGSTPYSDKPHSFRDLAPPAAPPPKRRGGNGAGPGQGPARASAAAKAGAQGSGSDLRAQLAIAALEKKRLAALAMMQEGAGGGDSSGGATGDGAGGSGDGGGGGGGSVDADGENGGISSVDGVVVGAVSARAGAGFVPGGPLMSPVAGGSHGSSGGGEAVDADPRAPAAVHYVDVSFSLSGGAGAPGAAGGDFPGDAGGGGWRGGGGSSRVGLSRAGHLPSLLSPVAVGPRGSSHHEVPGEEAVAAAAAGVAVGVQGRLPTLKRTPSSSRVLVLVPGVASATSSPRTDPRHSGVAVVAAGPGTGLAAVSLAPVAEGDADAAVAASEDAVASSGDGDGDGGGGGGGDGDGGGGGDEVSPRGPEALDTARGDVGHEAGGGNNSRPALLLSPVAVPYGGGAPGLRPGDARRGPGASVATATAVSNGGGSTSSSSGGGNGGWVGAGGASRGPPPGLDPCSAPRRDPCAAPLGASASAASLRPHALVAPSVAKRLEALEHMPLAALAAALRGSLPGAGGDPAGSPQSRGGGAATLLSPQASVASLGSAGSGSRVLPRHLPGGAAAAAGASAALLQSLASGSLRGSSSSGALLSVDGERAGRTTATAQPRSYVRAALPGPLAMSPVRVLTSHRALRTSGGAVGPL